MQLLTSTLAQGTSPASIIDSLTESTRPEPARPSRNIRQRARIITQVLIVGLGLILLPIKTLKANNLPRLGEGATSISTNQEYALGQVYLPLLNASLPALDDPLTIDYVENLVYGLVPFSQLKDTRLSIIVINNDQLNAFVVPGGLMGVNGGLFLFAESEAEISAVIAHELAHLSQRHFARTLEEQQKNKIPNFLAQLGTVIAIAGGTQAGVAAAQVLQARQIENRLRFSRKNEQEADRVGILTLVEKGIDPRAMPQMFGRISRASRYTQRPPEFLLTHPVTQSRISDSSNRAERYPKVSTETSLAFELIRARMQMRFANSPEAQLRQFESGLKLLHAEGIKDNAQLAGQTYGLALAQMANGQFKPAQTSINTLLKQDPDRIAYLCLQAELWLAEKKTAEAIELLEDGLEINVDNYPLTLSLVNAYLAKGTQRSAQQAVNALKPLSKKRSKDPRVWYFLAETLGLAGDTLALHEARAEYFLLTADITSALKQLNLAKDLAKGDFARVTRIDQKIAYTVELEKQLKQLIGGR